MSGTLLSWLGRPFHPRTSGLLCQSYQASVVQRSENADQDGQRLRRERENRAMLCKSATVGPGQEDDVSEVVLLLVLSRQSDETTIARS